MMRDTLKELAPVAPPVGVVTWYGLSIPEWAAIGTVIYTVVMLLLALPKLSVCAPCMWRNRLKCPQTCPRMNGGAPRGKTQALALGAALMLLAGCVTVNNCTGSGSITTDKDVSPKTTATLPLL